MHECLCRLGHRHRHREGSHRYHRRHVERQLYQTGAVYPYRHGLRRNALLSTLTVETIPTGVAYAIWSGLGIVLITIAAYFIHGRKIDAMGMLGMAPIVAGLGVVNLFSKSAGR